MNTDGLDLSKGHPGELAQQRILQAGRTVEDAWRAAVGTAQYDSMKQTLTALAEPHEASK